MALRLRPLPWRVRQRSHMLAAIHSMLTHLAEGIMTTARHYDYLRTSFPMEWKPTDRQINGVG